MFYYGKSTGYNQGLNKHQTKLPKKDDSINADLTNNQNTNTSLSISSIIMPQTQKNNYNDYHQAPFSNNLYNENSYFSNDYFSQNSNFNNATNDPDFFLFDSYSQYQDPGIPINLELTDDYFIDSSVLTQNQNDAQEQNNLIQSNFESTQSQTFHLSPKQTAIKDSEIGVSENPNLISNTESSLFQNSVSPIDFEPIQNQNPNLSLFPQSTQDPTLSEENLHANEHQCASSTGSTNPRKKKIKLDENASLFKFGFYKIFLEKRKKFDKNLVKLIHNSICSSLHLRTMPRECERSIDLYFQTFSQYSNQILRFLQQHKEELLDEHLELRELK